MSVFSVGMVETIGRRSVLDARAEVQLLSSLGFDRVELWAPWNVTWDTAQPVMELLAGEGIAVGCVSAPAYLHGDEGGEGARLLAETIRIARRLGAPLVNTYFGHGGTDDTEAARRYATLIRPFLDQAEEAGVVLVLENEFDAFGEDPTHSDISRRPASVRTLLELVDHERFRVNFDAANYYCAGADVATGIKLLAEYVAYVHVKDAVPVDPTTVDSREWKVYPDGDRLFQMVPLGAGEVPWPDVFAGLDEAGYAGPYNLEPHCRPPLLATALRQARAALEQAGR